MNKWRCDKLCSDVCCADYVSALENPDGWQWIDHKCSGLIAAYKDIDEPKTLAELMAMALRARGIDAAVERWQITQPPSDIVIWHDEQNIRIYGGRVWQVWRRSLSMAQACASILAIMRTPADESSKSQCEQIIMDDNHNTTGPTRITHEHH